MFRNIEYIYMVYKEKSFVKAAEKLHISQPSLSATIKKEEARIGAQIFNRNTKPVSLTQFGYDYIRAAEQFFDLQKSLKNKVMEINTLQGGTIALGGSNLGLPYLIPQMIARFKHAYPNVKLTITDTDTQTAKRLLESGELDLFFTNSPLSFAEFESVFCYKEHLVLAVPQSWPINDELAGYALSQSEIGSRIFCVGAGRSIKIDSIKETPLILLHAGNYLRYCTDMIFSERDMIPNVILEVAQSAISLNFARYGLGATILSSRLLEARGLTYSLRVYKIDSRYAERDGFICYRKGANITPAMKRLIDMFKEELDSTPA